MVNADLEMPMKSPHSSLEHVAGQKNEPCVNGNGHVSGSTEMALPSSPSKMSCDSELPEWTSTLPSPEQQKELIEALVQENQDMFVGDTWYIVEKVWFDKWTEYTGYEDPNNIFSDNVRAPKEFGIPPGPIENHDLIDESYDNVLGVDGASFKAIKKLAEGTDYVFVPSEAWLLLEKWHVIYHLEARLFNG